MTTLTMADHVLAITQDMFTAMIDGEPGLLVESCQEPGLRTDPVDAWVDVRSAQPVRALVTTERPTAERIARALLAMGPQDPVDGADLSDALGEVANVIGGNLKGIMPDPGTLSLPGVSLEAPAVAGTLAWERRLLWRGEAITISMWDLDEVGTKGQMP